MTSQHFACFHGYYFLLADIKYNNQSVFTFDASDVTGTHFSYQHGDVITSLGHHVMPTTTTTTTAAMATKQSHRNSGKHVLPTRSRGCWCVMVYSICFVGAEWVCLLVRLFFDRFTQFFLKKFTHSKNLSYRATTL